MGGCEKVLAPRQKLSGIFHLNLVIIVVAHTSVKIHNYGRSKNTRPLTWRYMVSKFSHLSLFDHLHHSYSRRRSYDFYRNSTNITSILPKYFIYGLVCGHFTLLRWTFPLSLGYLIWKNPFPTDENYWKDNWLKVTLVWTAGTVISFNAMSWWTRARQMKARIRSKPSQ